nr:LLM class flavin-dependent oxidoreductase [Cohnella sp. REN36]
MDQSVIGPGEGAADALRHTIELARLADRWGYHRFWVSEHHDSNLVAGSSPEVLISHLLALTERIRVGSGGVMLQHYSPYKVAENFNVLASLAPGRVDLGIGRTPGGLPLSMKALQKGHSDAQPLPDKIGELRQFLHDRVEADSPFAGLVASPVPDHPADLILLGASVSSARTAGSLGLPYVFAQFINGDPDEAEAAIRVYREAFRPSGFADSSPESILSLPVIVADTEDEARRLSDDYKVVRIWLESGRTITVGSVAHAEEYGRQAEEPFRIEVEQAYVVHGTKESVFRQVSALAERCGVGEIVAIASVKDAAKRLRSFELLKEAFAEAAVIHES